MSLLASLRTLLTYDVKESLVADDLVISGGGMWGSTQPRDYEAYSKLFGSEVWVLACAVERANAVASVPFIVTRNGKPVQTVPSILQRPNPQLSWFELIEAWSLSMLLTGDAYFELVGNRMIQEMWPLRASRLRIIPAASGMVSYTHTVNGKEKGFAASQIFHTRYPDPDNDWYGITPIQSAAYAVDTSEYARKWNKNFFKNSARPDAILEMDGKPQKDSIKRLKSAWQKKMAGVDNAHKLAIFTDGMKYREISVSPKDALLVDILKLGREEICAAMRVPPGMVGILDYANYSNMKEQQAIFYGGPVKSDLRRLEDAINRDIMPRIGVGLSFAFDMGSIDALKEDETERVTRDKILVDSGQRTINELRERDGLLPVAWGNTWYIPFNMVAVDYTPDAKAIPVKNDHSDHKLERSLKHRIMEKRTFAARSRRLDPIIRASHSSLVELFSLQEKKALKKLAQLVGKGMQMKLTASELLDWMEEEGLTDKALYKHLTDAVVAGALNGEQLVGGTIAWDVDNAAVRDVSKSILKKLDVNGTTKDKLSKQITEGMNNGEGYQGIKARVESVFADAKGYRAEMIARTESANGWGQGQQESYKANGVEKNEWLFGSGPCDFGCEQADGEVVKVGDDFSIGSSSEPAHPNCTCTTIPYLD